MNDLQVVSLAVIQTLSAFIVHRYPESYLLLFAANFLMLYSFDRLSARSPPINASSFDDI